MAAGDAVGVALEELYKSLSIDSIIGEPIEMGDKIIIPVTKMGIVFSTGLHSRAQDNCAEGRAGGGGGIFPVAIVIVFKDIKGPEGIRIMPLAAPSAEIGLAESLSQMALAAVSKLNVNGTASEKKP